MDNENLYDGFCEFCGQVVQYDEETLHEAKGDRKVAAKLICDCIEAKVFQRKRKNITKGIQQVNAIVGRDSGNPVSKEMISYLHRSVANIVNRKMIKATVQISSREKVEVKMTNKGIKVSREIKKKVDSETEMII